MTSAARIAELERVSETPIVDKVLPAVLYSIRKAGYPEKLFTEPLLAECVVFGDDYANLLHVARRLERALKVAEDALDKVAAFHDESANERLLLVDSYSAFDEPHAVKTARAALAQIKELRNGK